MKKVFLLLFATLFSINVCGQSAYDKLFNFRGEISVEDESMLVPSSPVDVELTFFEAIDQVKTNSKLPADEIDDLTDIKRNEFVLLYKLSDYRLTYNTTNGRLTFYIGVNDYNASLDMKYIGVGKEICLTFPTSRVKRERTRTRYGDYFIQQFLSVNMPQNVAKTVLNRVKSTNHDINIAFIVKPIKVLSEKRTVNYGGYVGVQTGIDDFLICKTIGLYLVDTKTEEILYDLSQSLAVTAKKRK